jgi:hypothetical protein
VIGIGFIIGWYCCLRGAPVIWFDYELGEKEFYKGFVCDEHKGSNRVEKLPLPQSTTAIV